MHTIRWGHSPKYYTVTLKSRLRVTQGHWKQKHWIDHTRLTISQVNFDVEYYRNLEMRVRGYSRSSKMVPFESFAAVSYSASIVTIAVSLAISEIFSVKEWPDLEILVWVHSRSLKMVQFDRPRMTLYWSAIVTIAQSCTIFELFYVE